MSSLMKNKKPKKKVRKKPSAASKTKVNKRLPKRKTKEMSVRSAKRVWFAPRKKGRRSKIMSEKLAQAKKVLLKAKEPLKRPLARKGKRGRPRKHPINNKPKGKRGRPRKHPKPDPNKPKRERGRPRKHPKPDPNKPKRGRGRPRKHPKPDPNKPKRGRGRPRKHPKEEKPVARKRGRPRKHPEDELPKKRKSKKAGEKKRRLKKKD